jgi:hypothetical protein
VSPGILTALILVAFVALAIHSERRKQIRRRQSLRVAPTAATRIEVVKAHHVSDMVAQYAREGWTVTDQSTAKSFASEARVTITFRKPLQ